MINDPLEHQAGLLMVSQLDVDAPELEHRSGKLRTERIRHEDVIKRIQRLVVPSHAKLAFADPIVGLGGER